MSWISYGMLAIAVTLLVLYVAPYAVKIWQRITLRRRSALLRTLVLTYDDGPSPDITPSLLDLLAKYDAKATFFLLGSHARERTQLVDRLVSEGHEVGCHSENHYHPWKTAPWKITPDMESGYRSLARWMKPNGLFRPPYGKPFTPVLVRLALRGVIPSWWTDDSGDTRDPRPSFERTLESVKRSSGGVVLMHDYRAGDPAHRDYVLRLTEQLLELARAEGLRVQCLSSVQGIPY